MSNHGVGWVKVCLDELAHLVNILRELDELNRGVRSQ